ncbi:TIGR04104 family putative zinc finger protein [Gracilibacillus xinjiangensis]|uniref:TIGR04104 family putative zinc finger protein n=1 Tax=Gracilibacillus xinjiangensis TaxID=1193282 RepID=A0ABV8WX66_9BACI
MQTCENCNQPFKWSSIYKSLWINYKPVTCKACGTIHKITISSRFIFSSLTILPLIIFSQLMIHIISNIWIILLLALCVSFICSLFGPFLVSYRKRSCESMQ